VQQCKAWKFPEGTVFAQFSVAVAVAVERCVKLSEGDGVLCFEIQILDVSNMLRTFEVAIKLIWPLL